MPRRITILVAVVIAVAFGTYHALETHPAPGDDGSELDRGRCIEDC